MRPGRRSERGESLIELLVTLSIMSIAVVAIVGAIATAVRLSDVNRRQTLARGYLTAFAETIVARVSAPTTGYIPCANTDGSQYDGFYSPPAPYVPKVVQVEYWNGSAFVSTGCTAANDTGVQRLQLRVRIGTGDVINESIRIVIRRPCRPGETC